MSENKRKGGRPKGARNKSAADRLGEQFDRELLAGLQRKPGDPPLTASFLEVVRARLNDIDKAARRGTTEAPTVNPMADLVQMAIRSNIEPAPVDPADDESDDIDAAFEFKRPAEAKAG